MNSTLDKFIIWISIQMVVLGMLMFNWYAACMNGIDNSKKEPPSILGSTVIGALIPLAVFVPEIKHSCEELKVVNKDIK